MMLSKEVDLKFGEVSRNRGSAFAIQRSKAKLHIAKTHRSLLDDDLLLQKHNLIDSRGKYQIAKKKSNHNSEKVKKRLRLIEDYFYPESTAPWIDPGEHAPIIASETLSVSAKGRKYQPLPTLKYLEGSMAVKEGRIMLTILYDV